MSKLYFAFICLIAAISASPASAQNFSTTKIEDETPKTEGVQPVIQFDLKNYNYSSGTQYDHSTQQQIELQLGHKQTGPVFSESQLIVGSFSEPQSFYFAVPELFAGVGKKDGSFVAAGRLKKNFNFLDSFYNMGLYNPYFTNDFIDYKEQGLTGVHAQFYNGLVGGYASFMPYFLPNQAPQVREENGNLVSSNRWAQRPPPRVEFVDDRTHPVNYVIRDYRLSEIIEHQGQAASFFVGANIARPVVQVSYANKPLNEIPLTRDTYASAIDSVGRVYLSPVVTYHEVKSADLNLDFKNIRTTLSYMEDAVQNKTAVNDETLQNLRPLKVYGAYVAADLSLWAKRELTVSVAAAEMTGGDIKDLNHDGNETVLTFSAQRTQFKSPVTFGAATELAFINAKPLRSEVRWTYDRAWKGTLLSAQFSYEAVERLFVNVGADLIGVEQELPEDATKNFLNDNRANDRVYGGLQYAF